MSDTTEFFLVLAAIYLAECVVRAPRSAVAFLPRPWSGWRILPGRDFYGNPRWGLFLANPIPEFSAAVVCELWPVSIAPAGVYSYVAQAFNPGTRHEQRATFHRFEGVRTAEPAGRDVMINGEAFVRTGSPLFAEHLAELIRRLARLPHPGRGAAIDAALDASLDSQAARSRVNEFVSASGWLGAAATALFVHLFALCPFAAWRYGLALTWMWLLVVLVVLHVALMLLFHRAHRRLYRGWRSERRSHLATMLLMPLAAMRGPAYLARHLLAAHHPLAVARILCSEPVFQAFAAGVIRDLRHPIQPTCASEEYQIRQTEEYFRGRLLAAVERFLGRERYRPAEMDAPPQRDGDDHLAFCPRCHCQFIIPDGKCESCNLPLNQWHAGCS